MTYAQKINKSLIAITPQDFYIQITYPFADKHFSDKLLYRGFFMNTLWQRLNGVIEITHEAKEEKRKVGCSLEKKEFELA
ncbi:hypothetical protein LC607_08555 [Nostoc sp. CHAB 5824]|nr:hypothetical protein [Nostoc sp. CHAB 5824]